MAALNKNYNPSPRVSLGMKENKHVFPKSPKLSQNVSSV